MAFDTLAFIQKKKDGLSHSANDIELFIKNAVSGDIPDYQISAWLMAVCFRGLDFNETVALTNAIANSGKIFKWNKKGPTVVDKHSTGGVGDKVTLVVAPLVAAMGMRMGKRSGRGLGHTGGTIDKLESIPGFRTKLSDDEFINAVNTAGCAVCGQDKKITPADGLLYSIRDVTATVNQESLIASSIMSKKLAGGADYILLDVKVGSGAFMKSADSAKRLANLMTRIGKKCGRSVRVILSSMEEPLGWSVGNALEVIEAIEVLKNKVPENDKLRMLSIRIASTLAFMCGFGTMRKMEKLASSLLENGSALDRFRDMVSIQGGDSKVVENPVDVLPSAMKILKVPAEKNGHVCSCDALKIGELVRDLGGGRKTKTDKIDPAVGIILHKKIGDEVSKGEILCEIHTNRKIGDREAITRASGAYEITKKIAKPIELFISG
ncbi:MAG TPA: thymidine phosphorylase [Firmicutes bacterium]|nr:thymidine phosphorylase [Bacillota bacterium]